MNKFYLIILFLVSLVDIRANNLELQDSLIFEKYINEFQDQETLPINKIVVKTALFFEGRPYVSSTLESNKQETLIVNLREFDCNTFVETCIALAMTLKSENKTYDTFKSFLTKIRYRSGLIDGYLSRLHYVSDWKYDNVNKGILEDVSETLGGHVINKKIDFMSTHSQLYKNLKKNSSLIFCIQSIETSLNKRNSYVVINKDDLILIENKIEDGDIIAFATSINGLDYSHIAIAYHSDNGLSFIHASTRTMTVIREPQLLVDYCKKNSKNTGISVFRLNNNINL